MKLIVITPFWDKTKLGEAKEPVPVGVLTVSDERGRELIAAGVAECPIEKAGTAATSTPSTPA